MSGTCPRCDHSVKAGAAFCGYCGYGLEAPPQFTTGLDPRQQLASETTPLGQASPPLRSAHRPPGTAYPRGAGGAEGQRQGWGLTTIVLVSALLALLGIVGLGVTAVELGRQDRAQTEQRMAQEHYTQGLAYVEQGEYTLAMVEFELAVEMDPHHQQALAHLADVRQKVRGRSLLAPAATPSPTASANGASMEQLRAAFARADWEQALDLADRLAENELAAHRDEVARIRVEACYQSGLRLVEETKMVEAIRRFDQALALQPDNSAVAQARQRAMLYMDALASWGADWAQVIERLAALHTMQPEYKDVRQRLFDAYVSYGDQLVTLEDFCQADKQYVQALSLVTTAEVQAKRQEAQQRCAPPTLAGPRKTVVPAGTFVGRVVEQRKVESRIIYVRGRVLDRRGQGVEGVRVQISAFDWKVSATTDWSGQFSFDGLRDPVTFTLTLTNHPCVPVDAPTAWHRITYVSFEEAK